MKIQISNIFKLFSFEKTIKLYFMFFFVLLLTLLEALGIALIFPAILIITQADQNNTFFLFFENFTNFLNFESTMTTFLIIFLIVYLLKFLLSIFCIFYQYNFAFDFFKNISAKIYKSYLRKDFLNHVNLKSADLIRKISSDIDQATLNSVLPLFSLITEITIMIGILIFLLFLNLKLTLFVFFITFFLIFSYYILLKKPTDYWGNVRLINDTSKISLMQQSFLTINEIKILAAEKLMEKKFDEYNQNTSKAYKFQATIVDSNKFFVELAGIVMFVLLILIFFDKFESNFIGLISLYAASAFRFLPSINRLIVAGQKIRYSAPSVKKVVQEIESLNNNIHNSTLNERQSNLVFNNKLELKNIYFNFPNNDQIMKNLNLEILKYDKIGIKGPSGSGKSTLLYLISGLIMPSRGTILVDNILTNINQKGWYQKIGYSPQFTNLINDTIKENIIYGLDIEKKIETDKKIEEISKICLLNEFTDKNPEKLNTLVGENGLKVSGGQKQRIGIARTIFRDPEILILDESTSSLDPNTEEKLLSNLLKFGNKKTVIIASHKDTTLDHCNKIFNFENFSLKQIK